MPPDREGRDRRRRRRSSAAASAAATTRRSSTATNPVGNNSSDADPSASLDLAMAADHHRHHHQHIYPPPSAPSLSTVTSISTDDEGRSTRRVRIDDNNIASNLSAYCNNYEDSAEEEEEEVCVNVEVTASSTMECTLCSSNSFDTCTAPKAAGDGHTNSRRQSAPTTGSRHNLPPATSPTPTWPNSQLYQSLESMAASLSRLSATLLFTLWLVTGLPLLLLLPCTYDTAEKRMKYGPCHPMVLLLSFSWLINATLIICVMYALGYMDDSGMTPWQAAALGWTAGVSGVTYLQASLDGRTSEAMHRIMLRPFGIHIRPGGEGNTIGWLPSLVGMIPAIVLYFIADWFGEVREELACDEADDSSAPPIPESYGGNSTNATLLSRICPPWALPSPDGTLCCHVENQTGNWLEFAAYLAGSVLAGWAVIRFVAIFLIWGDDDIDLEDDVDGVGTYAKGTNGIGNAEAEERVKDVLVAYSRGEVSKNEIEMMLNRC